MILILMIVNNNNNKILLNDNNDYDCAYVHGYDYDYVLFKKQGVY